MLRVGTVPYLVGRPLDLGLEAEPGIALERRVPAALAAGLAAGELDVALVSSIELFRQPGARYLAGACIAGRGPVGSVQVFLRRPIEEVASVALDPASRAAAALVRVLFERLGPAPGLPRTVPRWVEVRAGAHPRAAAADAWLCIGDAALREHLASDAPPALDPCAEWCARTDLPFVFAVWLVRAGVELGARELAAFARARARGAARVDELADEAARAWRVPLEACRHYLARECVHDLAGGERASLIAFRDHAAALDLAQAALDPEPIPLPHG